MTAIAWSAPGTHCGMEKSSTPASGGSYESIALFAQLTRPGGARNLAAAGAVNRDLYRSALAKFEEKGTDAGSGRNVKDMNRLIPF
jgi:hypothetical protein